MIDAQTLVAQEIIDDFTNDAQLDVIGLWQVIRQVRKCNTVEAGLQQATLKLVEMLLARGFVAINSPYQSSDMCEPWSDQEPSSITDRIKREWDALGRVPTIPDIVWFDLPSSTLLEAAPSTIVDGPTDTSAPRPGVRRRTRDGQFVGYRETSKDGTPVIDVDDPNVEILKLRFPSDKPG